MGCNPITRMQHMQVSSHYKPADCSACCLITMAGYKVTVLITILLSGLSFSNAAFLSEPTSQIVFEGQVSNFSCHSDGTLFWQINGEILDFTQSDLLQSRGFEFSDTYIEGSVMRNISVLAGTETNNTVISCISVDSENVVTISENATLLVLGSPSNVLLQLASSNNAFKLTWAASTAAPTGFEPHNYTARVQYRLSSGQTQMETINVPVANGTTMYELNYTVPGDLLPLMTCSQFVFSVLSTNTIGDSQPVLVSWESPIVDPEPLEIKQCSLQFNNDDSITSLIVFTFPDLCHFQEARYSFSLSPADTNSEPVAMSDTRTFVGTQDKEVKGQLQNLELGLNSYYQATVTAELSTGQSITGQSLICSGPGFKPPSTGSLAGTGSNEQSSTEVVAGIAISSVILAVILVMNTVVLVVCYIKKR